MYIYTVLCSFTVKSRGSSLPESVRQVLDKEMIPIYGKQTPQEMNMEFLTCNTDSVPHRLAGERRLRASP